MIKTQILLWKAIEGNRNLKVRVRFGFVLIYSELAPTDPPQKKYDEAMSDERAPVWGFTTN